MKVYQKTITWKADAPTCECDGFVEGLLEQRGYIT